MTDNRAHIDFEELKKNPELSLSKSFTKHCAYCLPCLTKFIELTTEALEESGITNGNPKTFGFSEGEWNASDDMHGKGSVLLRNQGIRVTHSHDEDGGQMAIIVRETYQRVTEDGFSEITPRQLTFVIPYAGIVDLISDTLLSHHCLEAANGDSDSHDH